MKDPHHVPSSEHVRPNSIFLPGKRRRINCLAIIINMFVPFIFFVGLCAVLSFHLHYEHPSFVWLIVAFAAFLVLVAGLFTWRARRMQDRDPTWYGFFTLALFIAVVSATILGDLNFFFNMLPYYDIENLNTYPVVDPATDEGQMLMDAGVVYFAEGTKVDISHAIGFKNMDMYCIAPITNGNTLVFDFWAVGINCCSGTSPDFRCGEFANPRARSGLRLMRDDQRPSFRLAVQQAEAAYQIRSNHPLFFYWLQDPVREMEAYRDVGVHYFWLGVFTHFTVNFFGVLCAVVSFSKIGRY